MGGSKQVLRYNAPEHYTYENPDVLGDEQVKGGGLVTVSAAVAEDLLTDPHANFTLAEGDAAPISREQVLAKKDHDALVEIAEAAGVFNPGLIKDDGELVTAILDAEQPDEERISRLANNNTRDELDEQARAAGVDSPDALENKEAVAKAIVNQEAGATSGEGQTDSEVA